MRYSLKNEKGLKKKEEHFRELLKMIFQSD